MRIKKYSLNYNNYYVLTSFVEAIIFVILLVTGFAIDYEVNRANHDIMIKKRAELYEQSILEYKDHILAEKTHATYKAQSQQCCKAIPNKPLPRSSIPIVFK